ncbi:bifunctional diguanylate cyclase/phosphodiesterase [uncultured Demequina sp.]|uniref:putative bifunctional diguanylate cyclase/phosphodiesterase n=1 Tax=uncultured Demequina sp. TaxID=693499 RepID=UPI0025E5DCB8|nr:bifunctional diguanylate cyclase/phosphodiesterase [uncultured Demequina sp.]
MEVVLSGTRLGGGASAPAPAPPRSLTVYVLTIAALGAAALIAVVWMTPWQGMLDDLPLAAAVFLAVAAIVGEILPIKFVRPGSPTRSLSTSAPFVLALIPVAGLAVAVIVQLVATTIDDVRLRRAPVKSIFNSGQYVLSVTIGGAVFAMLANRPLVAGPTPVAPSDLLALLAGGLMMIAANWLIVAGVVSIATGQPLRAIIGSDMRFFAVTNLVLLSVGGLAAEVSGDGAWALALLAAPVIAAHVFAASAARHAHDATHDSLTGLGNRSQLQANLERALDATRTAGTGTALVLIDLDHFKDFNDTLGHPVGDTILTTVGARLIAAAPEDATVHRLGGDEFAVIAPGGLVDGQAVARDLLACFDEQLHIEGLELIVRASAGVAIAPQHGDTVADLMKNADIALYHAKLERDRISTFAPEFDVNTVERLQLLADVHAALDTRQLHVVYQPQVDLATGRIVGAEALVRWHHPRGHMIAPDEFIPLAENSGLIFPLTAYVLDEALGQQAQWRAQGYDLRMAVNLSARHLSDLGLPDQIAAALARHDVPASALVLEVTETGILSDPARADVVIKAVRALGVEIAIDDYGTGNASLSYLKRLEIDELKVDRSFVSSIGSDHHDLIIVRSTIDLALSLDLRVVAEGIEDAETARALRKLGNVIGQGHHLGYPVEAAELTIMLESRRGASAPSPGA